MRHRSAAPIARRLLILIGWVMCGGFAGSATSADPPAERFVHTSGPIRFVVTDAGLSEVHVGDKQVARGEWRARNTTALFQLGEDHIRFGPIADRSMRVVADDHVRVEHVYEHAAVRYDYLFDGEDVSIRARVSNRSARHAIEAMGFEGLRFDWASPPRGIMPVMHAASAIRQEHGVGAMHPGNLTRLGGTWAAGAGFGVGTSPAGPTLEQTLTMWDYTDWTPPQLAAEQGRPTRGQLPSRRLEFFARGQVPPLGARTFSFTLRVSTDTDWKHLLQPYKDWFRATLGPVRYKPTHRPWVMVSADKSPQFITPDNPYGYHDGHRRLDTTVGARQFCRTIPPLIREVHGQGALIWGQQGSEPRGAEYRPDFDVLPPPTRRNWPVLQRCMSEGGYRLGVTARPGAMAVRESWKKDRLVDTVPTEPTHVQDLVKRFENMIELGCTAFYLDSFGNRYEHVLMMRQLREHLPDHVQTFAEMHCDAMMPYSGFYLHITYDGEGEADLSGLEIMWLGKGLWPVFRWLVDGEISVAGRVDDRVYERVEPGLLYRWMLPRRITPLEQYARFPEAAAALHELLPRYLDEDGQWIEQPQP